MGPDCQGCFCTDLGDTPGLEEDIKELSGSKSVEAGVFKKINKFWFGGTPGVARGYVPGSVLRDHLIGS